MSDADKNDASTLKRALRAVRDMRARLDAVEREPIAVIGMGCRFPGGADSPDALWRLLCEGFDAVTEVPPERWNVDEFFDADPAAPGKICTRFGTFLRDIDQLDYEAFGLSAREAMQMDPQQRLFLEVAWEALDHAGVDRGRLAGSRTGVLVGVHTHSSDYALCQLDDWEGIDGYSATGSAHDVIAGRVAYLLDLRGPSMAVDTACSSSLLAVHLACQSLRSRDCDMAVAGGVNLLLRPEVTIGFSKMGMLSPQGRCRAFDADGDGFVRGEGCGVVVLKRLSDAMADGDDILAVIRGSAANQDGRSNGLTAPNAEAQRVVIERALERAGVAGQALGYIEAHGTGTPLGDPIEVEALLSVLRGQGPHEGAPCRLGSIKTNVGHLEGAAGVAGLIKAVLCVKNGMIPPHPHFRRLNPRIELPPGTFEIPTALTPWPAEGGARMAGISSFGWSGTNVHVILSQAPEAADEAAAGATVDTTIGATAGAHAGATASPTDPLLLLPLSAPSEQVLARYAADMQATVQAASPATLRDLCYTAGARRTHETWRLAAVGRSGEELGQKLALFAAGEAGPGLATGRRRDRPRGIVFVFQGHGGQWLGMGRDLLAEPAFRDALAACDVAIRPLTGWSVEERLRAADPRDLDAIDFVQPAVFAIQTGLAALWRSYGIEPDATMGHSFGEVAAAHVAGALSIEDAARVIVQRSRQLAAVRGTGAMAVVDMSLDEAESLAVERPGLEIAAVNGPRSIVLAGDPPAIDALIASLEARDVFCRRVAVDTASHCSRVDTPARSLETALHGIRPAATAIPMYSTVRPGVIDGQALDPAYWRDNLRCAVRFWDAFQALAGQGHQIFIELGPHPLLAMAMQQGLDAAGRWGAVVPSLRRDQGDAAVILESLGLLHCVGLPLAWERLHPHGGRLVRFPSRPWNRQRVWLSNHDLGKPRQRSRALAAGDPWQVVVSAGRRQSEVGPFDLRPERYQAKWAASDRLATAMACATLRAIGAFARAGTTLTADELLSAHGIKPVYHHLVQRWLQRLAGAGLLEETAEGFLARARLPEPDFATLWQEMRETFADTAFLLDYFERCAGLLPSVLTGQEEALETLFPGGSFVTAESMYRDWAAARYANGIVRAAVETALTAGPARPRLLEIGAGSGGTAATLLPVLDGRAGEYVFTDMSNLFLDRAAGMFAAYDWVTYAILDIDRDPGVQGFAPGSFDVVVASNVLHATRDIEQTLARVRALLAPGGYLVMYEMTSQWPWFEFSTGLIEGWQRFEDGYRHDHPLMPVAQWAKALARTGFVQHAAFPEAGNQAEALGQHVIVARAPESGVEASSARSVPAAGATARARQDSDGLYHVQWQPRPLDWVPGGRPAETEVWVVLCDRDAVGQAVFAALQADRRRCIRVFPQAGVAGPERLETDSFLVDPAQPAQVARLLDSVLAEDDPTRVRVIHLWSLDVPQAPELRQAGIQDILSLNIDSVVALLRAAAGDRAESLDIRLWLVTRGAQCVTDDDRQVAAFQAPLWGLGRVLEQEYPRLFGGLVDLDPEADAAANANSLVREIASSASEQVGIRNGQRYVARLAALDLPAGTSTALPVRADGRYLITGGLGELGRLVARRLVDDGARHLVLIGRSGLPERARWHELAGDPRLGPRIADVQALENLGAEVDIRTVDVGDPAAFARVLDDLRGDGGPAVAGIVHAAAQLDSKTLLELTPDQVAGVLGAKLVGGWLLHQTFVDPSLDFFVCFSSALSILGTPGHADYAAANAFLDTLAAQRRAQGLKGLTVSWGVWARFGEDSRGSAERLTRDLQGGRSLGDRDGLDALARLVHAGPPMAVAAPIDWSTWTAACPWLERIAFFDQHRGLRRGAPQIAAAGGGKSMLRDQLLTAAPGRPRRQAMYERLRRELAAVLRISADSIRAETPFREIGLDSLMALELRRRLEQCSGLKLSGTLVWNYPTIVQLGAYLAERLALPLDRDESDPDHAPEADVDASASAGASADAGTSGDDDALLAVLDQVSDLSADEIAAAGKQADDHE